MFQFPRFASRTYSFSPGYLPRQVGSPIRAPPDRRLFAASPGLFAGCRALRRLLPPRHPPYALLRLAMQPQPPWPGPRRRPQGGGQPSRFRFRFFTTRAAPAPFRGPRAALVRIPNCQRIAAAPSGATRKRATRTRLRLASRRPRLVEPGRIELPTSCVQGRRSPG